jgi:polyhydroxyalkanoate synthase
MMKPVTNYWTTGRRLWENVLNGEIRCEACQTMARWIADDPPFPARAFREWISWMYQEKRLVWGRLGWARAVDLSMTDQRLLIVTAGADYVVPWRELMLELVSSQDITRGSIDRAATSGCWRDGGAEGDPSVLGYAGDRKREEREQK